MLGPFVYPPAESIKMGIVACTNADSITDGDRELPGLNERSGERVEEILVDSQRCAFSVNNPVEFADFGWIKQRVMNNCILELHIHDLNHDKHLNEKLVW